MRSRFRVTSVALLLILVLAACGRVATPTAPSQVTGFVLSSPAFEQGKAIPRTYSCSGDDASPPLQWLGAPANTKSFALIMDDPDAPLGTWVHWVVFNIPADANSLPEKIVAQAQLPDGIQQGRNSSGKNGYSGPCPPSGTHRYFFRLYAVDITLDLPANTGKDQLLKAIEGHILGQAELMGTFSR